MKKTELMNLASQTVHNVLEQNNGLINSRVKSAIERNSNEGKISTHDSVAVATAVALTLVPEICATVTAQMLVELGLVELESE